MPFAAVHHGESGNAFLVALGAVPGAWLRFRLVNHLEPMLPRRHWGTVSVNLLACFVLGLLVSLQASCGEGSRRLMLLLGTGFLGSFSTFSTFIAEIHGLLRQRNPTEALVLLVCSVAGGLLALTIGLSLGAAS
ncbi:MAG: CrcB family protein [Cyanobium sp.]